MSGRWRAPLAGLVLVVGGCRAGNDGDATAAPPATSAPAPPGTTAGAPVGGAPIVIPPFPPIVVPDVLSIDGADAELDRLLGEDLELLNGEVSVHDARCADGDGVLASGDRSYVDEQDGDRRVRDYGSWAEVRDGTTRFQQFPSYTTLEVGIGTPQEGSIRIDADGSARVDGPGGYISWSDDGEVRWSDHGVAAEDDSSSVTVKPDGTARYSRRGIRIDDQGGGKGEYWLGGDGGRVYNNGDGSGRWWNGPLGWEVVAHGDGTGTIQESAGDDPVPVAVEPLPPVPPTVRPEKPEAFAPIGRSCGSVLRLDEEVLFEFGKAELRPEAGPVLDKVAQVVTERKVGATIVGHTDSVGDDASNQALSQARADAVRQGLVDRGAVGDLKAEGRGEVEPVAPNTNPDGSDNPGGRQQNRRVDIVIVDS